MIMGMSNSLAGTGSTIAGLMFLWAMVDRFIPNSIKTNLSRYTAKLGRLFNPYMHITIPEYTGEFSRRNEAYSAVEAYLTAYSSHQARSLKAVINKPNRKLSLTIDTYEEVVDAFQGTKVWWYSGKTVKTNTMSFSWYPDREERRWYRLSFHARNRKLVTEGYLAHVVNEGKAIEVMGRRKKLFTNNPATSDRYGKLWSSVVFDHPATFETLAMDPAKKKELLDDLGAFRKRKEYYSKIGKAWKRGYLLYGPPGTGKSSMIAAMANFMDYDVYDLELTAVRDNTELRKLLFDTASRSIIVIEDIDCSLDLAGKRSASKDRSSKEEGNVAPFRGAEEKNESKVTLSGLLNFIDGLWSACGGERIIVFTTNHIGKLDPALIRRGRMDMQVELFYCSFEGFKVLAKNYLGIDSHILFERIRELIGEVQITPADVAESLMPKSGDVDAAACLQNLVGVLASNKAKMDEAKSGGIKNEEMLVSDDNEENNESEESV